MAEVLTPSDVLVIMYNSDESLSDRSSDNEIDNIDVADAIMTGR